MRLRLCRHCFAAATIIWLWGCWYCGSYFEGFYCKDHFENDAVIGHVPLTYCRVCERNTGEYLIGELP